MRQDVLSFNQLFFNLLPVSGILRKWVGLRRQKRSRDVSETRSKNDASEVLEASECLIFVEIA